MTETLQLELTILMPCLNEAETIAVCVRKARSFLARSGVLGEVLVSDNGSSDGSQQLAEAEGARVVHAPSRGYGAALINGIRSARGRFVIMGDADDSYDFSSLDEMLAALRDGNDLVMGNRFRGGIRPGAMPLLHRYLGNPVLSFLGRLFFRTPVGDFHCGLRGFSRDAIQRLDLRTSGMEFASEMVVKASLHKLRIAEVPIVLSPDGRSRPPHLRTWRDGWRHLRFLLLFSPRWLFFIPGALLFTLGGVGMASIGVRAYELANVGLDIHTLAYAGAAMVLGYQMLLFSVFSKMLGEIGGWLPPDNRIDWVRRNLSLEVCLLLSLAFFAVGIWFSLDAYALWSSNHFGALDPRVAMRRVVPAVTALAMGGETALSGFFLAALRISERHN